MEPEAESPGQGELLEMRPRRKTRKRAEIKKMKDFFMLSSRAKIKATV
jgi:hypothetical protein